MKIFNNRKALFDMENFKRKTLNNTKTSLLEAKVDLENCVGKKLQDFKFKKLQNNFSDELLAKTFLNEKEDGSRIANLNKYQDKIIENLKKTNKNILAYNWREQNKK